MISLQLPHGFSVLTKGAYFDPTTHGRAQGLKSIWRWWFDISYAF